MRTVQKRKEIFATVIFEEWRLLGCYAVSLVRNDVLKELSASIIRVTRIGELGTTFALSYDHTA
jgi:hypothetical protein